MPFTWSGLAVALVGEDGHRSAETKIYTCTLLAVKLSIEHVVRSVGGYGDDSIEDVKTGYLSERQYTLGEDMISDRLPLLHNRKKRV